MQSYDVIVAGAGPAGTAAAITARARGLSVLVCDRAAFPRDKTCGDGLTAQALRLVRQLGLRPDTLASFQPVVETMLVSSSGRQVSLPLASGHAAVVTRAELDAAFVAIAHRRGAHWQEQAVVDVVATDDGVKVVLAGGDAVEAPYLIAADGHWSTVRRRLHPDAPRDLGEWHAVRQYVSGVDDERLWVIFDAALLPGYAWVFPLPDGGANVGFGVLRAREGAPARQGRDMKALWNDVRALPIMRELLSDAVDEGPMRAWPIPTRYEPEALADGPVLYVGDAARVVDPMTGEGIAQALETGQLAIEAIASGGDADTVAGRYRADVHRALGRDLRFAHRLQSLLTTPLGARGAIRAAGLSNWTRRNFARWLFEDYPRAILLTPDRWL